MRDRGDRYEDQPLDLTFRSAPPPPQHKNWWEVAGQAVVRIVLVLVALWIINALVVWAL